VNGPVVRFPASCAVRALRWAHRPEIL